MLFRFSFFLFAINLLVQTLNVLVFSKKEVPTPNLIWRGLIGVLGTVGR